jgi:hypothetical protein
LVTPRFISFAILFISLEVRFFAFSRLDIKSLKNNMNTVTTACVRINVFWIYDVIAQSV